MGLDVNVIPGLVLTSFLFSDVEVFEPFPMLTTERFTHVTYLDTVGRPSILFKKKRLTDKHTNTIYVRVPNCCTTVDRLPVVLSPSRCRYRTKSLWLPTLKSRSQLGWQCLVCLRWRCWRDGWIRGCRRARRSNRKSRESLNYEYLSRG